MFTEFDNKFSFNHSLQLPHEINAFFVILTVLVVFVDDILSISEPILAGPLKVLARRKPPR